MTLPADALRAEAHRLRLVLTDEDLAVIAQEIARTYAELARCTPRTVEWPDPPSGYVPPADRPRGPGGG